MELPAPLTLFADEGAYDDVLVVAPLGESELRYEKADADWTSRRAEIPKESFMVTHSLTYLTLLLWFVLCWSRIFLAILQQVRHAVMQILPISPSKTSPKTRNRFIATEVPHILISQKPAQKQTAESKPTMMASTALTVAAAGHRNGSNEETEHQQLANGSLLASIARFLPAPQKRRDLENILLGVPPGERSEFLRALLCDEVSDPLATGSLLARIAGFLSVREGGVQNVLVALPTAAERIEFRKAYLSHNVTAFLSEAAFPAAVDAITDTSIRRHLASDWVRHKFKVILNTPAGAKFLRQSADAGAAGMGPYELDSNDGHSFNVFAFRSPAFAIALDNPELLEWSMEVGSIDPNGCHDAGLVAGTEVDDATPFNLLYMCIESGSKECFEWLLARDDVDPNVQAYHDANHWHSVVSLCILCAYSGLFGDVAYFLRRLIEHPATDINRASPDGGPTPLQHWATAFAAHVDNPDLDVTSEGALRILDRLLEGGAKADGDANTVGPTPFRIVGREAMSGSPEYRARHLLALDLMEGGGIVSCLLLLGNGTSSVGRMHRMVASGLKLGLPSTFISLLFELVRLITFPPFVIKRGLRDFVDLLRLTFSLLSYYCCYISFH